MFIAELKYVSEFEFFFFFFKENVKDKESFKGSVWKNWADKILYSSKVETGECDNWDTDNIERMITISG